MHLGAFSISLPVKDLEKSKAFYEALGFTTMGDFSDQGWMILKSGDTIIGLFKDMFEKPMLTFNPGWDQNAQNLESFSDIREIQERLKAQGLHLESEVEEGSSGPASITLIDPDGNPILIDQHR